MTQTHVALRLKIESKIITKNLGPLGFFESIRALASPWQLKFSVQKGHFVFGRLDRLFLI